MRRILSVLPVLLISVTAASQTLTSSNLPIIIINTNGQTIVDDPKIMADMGIIYNGAGVRNNVTDPFNHYNGKIGIEIRGQSSQMFPMKSYGFELWDNTGNSQEKSLFGLQKESDWILYAPYTDKTLMRNFLAYTMSRELGHWASNCRFAEVVINGDYKGIYVFMERIKRGSGRVGIAKINATDVSGDAVTGGYIFSLDKEPNGWFSSFVTPGSTNGAKRQFSYVYPKPENIVQPQKDYIKSYVDSFENALAGAQFQDPVNGVRKFADLPSFIDYFIVNEISRNVDGYRLSSYFYKDRNSRNSKIFAGPVWDYDLAFRNANYCDGWKTTGWAYDFNIVCPGDGAGLIPFWWNNFMKDTAFKGSLRCRWKQLRSTTLSEGHFVYLVDSITALINEARQRHFQRWPVLGVYIWPNPSPLAATYEQEIAFLKSWIHDRLLWIDENLPNSGACAEYNYPSNVQESLFISIRPNPLTGNGNIIVESRMAQPVNLNVFDMNGRKIYASRYNLSYGYNSLNIPSGSWSTGVYFLSFETSAGEKFVRKVVK
ncbi:MAG TPA: CotH kinase family protein [Chitinophagaceae bacterium]|nr:CotH kinase family protein [Chitinophagaceae bacterium]